MTTRLSRSCVPLLLRATLLAAALFLSTATLDAGAQIPTEFRNLQVLPQDIASDSLVLLMRSFSFATSLGCEDCHVMGEGGSFQGAQFHLDSKPAKEKARAMIQLVERLNDELLPELLNVESPDPAVECKTCHRGLSEPFLLRTELHRVIDEEGVAAAEERYRWLRENRMERGAYDFGEWETNELARELEAQGQTEAAVAMLELNEEFHPMSASIPRTLGPLYEALGRNQDALAAYARAVGRNPRDASSMARLQALMEGNPR